jgi:phenylacetate-CoA ligase
MRQLHMGRLFHLIRASKSLRQTQSLSRPDMLALQEQRWRSLARHALATSPFYRRHLAGIDPDRCSLKDIPPLTKPMLVEHWDEIVADPRLHRARLEAYLDDRRNWGKLLHGRWMVCKTSGSSGPAITLAHDIESLDWMHAVHSVRNGPEAAQSHHPTRHPFRRRPRLVAFVRGSSPSASAALYHTRPWVGALFTQNFCINATLPWEQMRRRLQELQPDVLIVYASMLERLALAQLAGELRLDFSRPGAAISTGGDMLTPGIRDLCRRAFGHEPLNGYGAAESPAIARQWKGMDHLTLLEDLTVFESVGVDEQDVPEGDASDHVLVTPLFNRAVPLLRYRLNDRVRLGPVQPGWPFRRIDSLLGRTAITYVFQVPEKRIVVGLDLLKGLDGDPRLTDTQVRQTGQAGIECLFRVADGVSGPDVAAEIMANMRSYLDERDCQQVSCTTRQVTFLEPDPATGKVERWIPFKA